MRILTKYYKFLIYLILCLFVGIELPWYAVEEMREDGGKIVPPQVVIWNLQDGRKLIYIAVHHTNKKDSSIHQKIFEVFQNENLDVFLMEGISSSEEGISSERVLKKAKIFCEEKDDCDENLYAAYLASQRNIPIVGCHLNEHNFLPGLEKAGFSLEDFVYFILVQQIPFFYRDGDFATHERKFTPDTWQIMSEEFIHNEIAGWLKTPLEDFTFEGFRTWWGKKFKKPLDMEKEFSDWKKATSFTYPDNNENALITQKISFWVQQQRDIYILEQIKEALKKYKVVLTVHGSYHLGNQYSRLLSLYGKPIKIELLESII
jgi:hypothetical protein